MQGQKFFNLFVAALCKGERKIDQKRSEESLVDRLSTDLTVN